MAVNSASLHYVNLLSVVFTAVLFSCVPLLSVFARYFSLGHFFNCINIYTLMFFSAFHHDNRQLTVASMQGLQTSVDTVNIT